MRRFCAYVTAVALCGVIVYRPAAAAPADNLLPNAGFEQAGDKGLPAGWVSGCTGGSKAERVTGVARTGQACGHFVKVVDGKSHVAALVYPRVSVEGGKQYTLSGWGRSDVETGQARLFAYGYDKTGRYLGHLFKCSLPRKAAQWQPLRAAQKVPPECSWVQIRFELYGLAAKGQAWVDDVFFGPYTGPAAPVRRLKAVVQGRAVRLSWQAPPGQKTAGYRVYGAPYADFAPLDSMALAFTRNTNVTIPLLKNFVGYYAVCALDETLNPSPPARVGPVRHPGAKTLPAMLVWADGPGKRWDEALPAAVPRGRADIRLESARGEWGSAQVLVGATKVALKHVTAEASVLRGPKGATLGQPDVSVLRQDYVRVASQNRFAPDPLPPAQPVKIAVGRLRGWQLLIHVPETARPGEYVGAVTVAAEGQPAKQVPVRLKVWPVTVPRANHYGGSWGLWGAQVAQYEQVKAGSSEYKRLMRRYAEFLLDHRMIPRWLPGDIRSPETAAWIADERVASFPLPSPAGWNKTMTPAQQKAFNADMAFLREKGWLGKGYCYWADEPAPKDYPRIVELAKQAHAAGADVPFLMTEQPEPALFGAVDLWCPVLGVYAARVKQCRERQKLGEHVWWYVACGPLPPWPNYMLTNAPLDARVLSWLQVKYGVEGELYWSTTCWPGDVWSEGLSRVYPGDGYLCYPGKPRGARGPVTSIRAEMVRAGKQDIELIWLLRRLAARRARQEETEQVIRRAIARVCTDFTHFTKRDADLDAARRMILSQIVALQE